MKTISAAFVKAKRAFGPALKDKTNPAFRSKYADLGACIDAIEDALLTNGIAFIQETFEDSTGVTVETVFLHESGESIRCGKLHVPASKQDPQGYGSALTYARRYSLCAAAGIAPEDDDGNAASKAKKPAGVSHSGPAIALAGLSPDWLLWVSEWSRDISNTFEQQGEDLDPSIIAAMWGKLPSKMRSALKASKAEPVPA
jgi:hypothetical protein